MRFLRPPENEDYELKKYLGDVWAALNYPLPYFVTEVDSDYEASKTDWYIGVENTSAPRTVTLPALNSMKDGAVIIVKDESGACSTNNITVEGYGAETIDGSSSYLLDTDYAAVHLIKRPGGWFTL